MGFYAKHEELVPQQREEPYGHLTDSVNGIEAVLHTKVKTLERKLRATGQVNKRRGTPPR